MDEARISAVDGIAAALVPSPQSPVVESVMPVTFSVTGKHEEYVDPILDHPLRGTARKGRGWPI
ncbi:hypothetical protein [Kitasatospora sp. NPDC085464]|uniref:hypothetical protein n=1 Tax=Kitasatospora sp. NPDC085464 TaxID=3364063 RepID=UPI0037C9BADD